MQRDIEFKLDLKCTSERDLNEFEMMYIGNYNLV
jgi:hypothetical protein